MSVLRHLFEPIRIGPMEVRNRIVMPPMGTGLGEPGGQVTERHLAYYEARAKGGVGLVIVEVTTVNPARRYAPMTLSLFDDRFIAGWRRLAEAVHVHGARIGTQLLDPGPEASAAFNATPPWGPSPVASRTIRELPRELSVEEIQGVVEDFAEAARRGREAGLDAVEVHAAHGYCMVGSFLSPFFNKRTDRYGGDIEGRARLLVEIIQAIKGRAGEEFPVIVRLSGEDRVPGGRSIQETQFIASMLVEAGAGALEISSGTVPHAFWAVIPPSGTPLALNASLAEAVKRVVPVPVICVGRINTPQVAEFVIASGKADLVSMGRALIADPELPNKAASGRFHEIIPCVGDNHGCLSGPMRGRPSRCTVNPAMGREREMVIVPAARPKRVLVAGGGPAGLQAAHWAALRGHEVRLFEKERKLGGQVNLASVPPFMQELSKLIQYLSRQVREAGVRVELGTEVTPGLVQEEGPEVVVVATGALPVATLDIPGDGGDRVVTAWDVLAGKAGTSAKRVLIIGGGLVGCETADFLAETGDNPFVGRTEVVVVEVMDEAARDMPYGPRHLLMERLRAKGVKIFTSTVVKKIREGEVLLATGGREESIPGVDWIVMAVGSRPLDDLSHRIRGMVPEVYVIGDAKRPRKILDATTEGAEVAVMI
ncbi:MAG: oxidoreductase [Thermodesulfobacteriota bacterium]